MSPKSEFGSRFVFTVWTWKYFKFIYELIGCVPEDFLSILFCDHTLDIGMFHLYGLI